MYFVLQQYGSYGLLQLISLLLFFFCSFNIKEINFTDPFRHSIYSNAKYIAINPAILNAIL